MSHNHHRRAFKSQKSKPAAAYCVLVSAGDDSAELSSTSTLGAMAADVGFPIVALLSNLASQTAAASGWGSPRRSTSTTPATPTTTSTPIAMPTPVKIASDEFAAAAADGIAGLLLGAALGAGLGARDGARVVGCRDGVIVGCLVGENVAPGCVGTVVVGASVGPWLGVAVGPGVVNSHEPVVVIPGAAQAPQPRRNAALTAVPSEVASSHDPVAEPCCAEVDQSPVICG